MRRTYVVKYQNKKKILQAHYVVKHNKKLPVDEGVHEARELGGIGFELGVGSPALERR